MSRQQDSRRQGVIAPQLDSVIRSSYEYVQEYVSDSKQIENFSDSDDDEFNVPQENIEFAVSCSPTNIKASTVIQQT
jgi:hypothetical protein